MGRFTSNDHDKCHAERSETFRLRNVLAKSKSCPERSRGHPYKIISRWGAQGPSTCSHRASAARDCARDEKPLLVVAGNGFFPRLLLHHLTVFQQLPRVLVEEILL